MSTTPEGKVKAQIRKRLDKLGVRAWYFCPAMGPFGFAGVPDIVGCYDGRFFAIEVKAAGKHPTRLQEMCMAAIVAAGGHVMVIRGEYTAPEGGQDPGWARFDMIFTDNNWRV